MMSLTSSKGSHTSHSPRQSISHSSHGGSPRIPTSSVPAFLKHGNDSSAEATHSSYGYSLPTVPTINSCATSPSNSATSPIQLISPPNTSRLPGGTFNMETLPGGMSTPTLALTVPSPTTGYHSPAMSLANSNHSALSASPINDQGGSFSRAFPPTDNYSPDKLKPNGVFLTRSLVESVFYAYDAKLLKTSPEVRRAVRKEQKANKDKKKDSVSYAPEEDNPGKDGISSIAGLPSVASHSHLLSGSSLPLASGFKAGLTSTLASTLTGGNIHSGAASILMPMSDLEEFIDIVIGEISYRRTREEKREKKEKKERDKVKVKEEKEERKERERDRKEVDNLSSSSSSDGLVDFSKAAKKVKAKVKGRSVDKLRDVKGDEWETTEGKDPVKEFKKRKDKDNVGGVGGLVLGLWTGSVNLVVKLREKTEEREREREKNTELFNARQAAERDGILSDGFDSWRSNPAKDPKHRPSIWSDGDTDSHLYVNDSTNAGKRASLPAHHKHSPTFARRSSVSGPGSRSRYGSVQSGVILADKSDGRSTEEEGPGLLGSETLGALWAKSGSKVKGKLESWAG
ncbi:hypothetical protein J3R30DRAFT_2857252 [Lentinula aciculospora]|uniref:Uncharacterized protein n=1 Tax=Lentinula aciculospora TaxID=153920 RepID=A0A9W9AAC1_9AGAR|nr:hypothetical protein J3R30DRAFT_2857252 [Lentinula aciculospora]